MLGFLNPLLYSKGSEAFTDVTVGSNFGCNTTSFPATKDWDAVSGLGAQVCKNKISAMLIILAHATSSGSKS